MARIGSPQRCPQAGDAKWAADPHILIMEKFDFSAPADIFTSKGRGVGRRPMTYRRFSTGAEAVRYAIETLPAETLYGTVMEVDEARFAAEDIRRLYESPGYPLQRATTQ